MTTYRHDCPPGLPGKRIALTLGSGGARGYAHIGVLQELAAREYEIVAISGCSMGALIGGIYAAGKLEDYRQWVEELGSFGVLRLLDMSFTSMGAMQGKKVMSKIESFIGDVAIEDLPIPFTAVATDLVRQREVWFQRGSLLKAIRASIAIPGVFTPVEDGPRLLVDGGLLNPLPIISNVSVHADLVMAVNVTANSPQLVTLEELLPTHCPSCDESRDGSASPASSPSKDERRKGDRRHEAKGTPLVRRLLDSANTEAEADRAERGTAALGPKDWGRLATILTSFDITQAALARYKEAGYPPDILVEVPKTVCGSFEFHRARDLIRLGRHLTCQALDRIETCGLVEHAEVRR
ncbi:MULTISPECIES: patatin-like phospholipase family protein [unclassified Halomonas]|uniref:patatin-like phospholipase family protein n=1 Tax=unclassified Halomonas TaxID=2609666 RepID=UPI001C988741|nr:MULTISPECIES: patatin-like phospholipase family protein [unclassified Halomonas]MBY5924084.1 patatin-like phospholipase family protein [Halomonas sp. DP4Y7-2]MBY6231126.1 patatin-like phospholipase family protein [Halomonas sp. DP4Y7-1]